MPLYGAPVDVSALTAVISAKADVSAIPSPSDATPYGCGVPASGVGSGFARFDHVHSPFPYSEVYRDSGQTTGIQTITLRSIPVPVNVAYDIDVVIIGLTSALTQSARVGISCVVARGAGNVFRSGTPLAAVISGIGGIVGNITANTGTQSADITITGGAATTTNWKCWTIVRKGT